MAPRRLSEADLNRAVLARQLLLERSRASLPKALERIGGIQAQYAPAMYIGMWSRLEGLERDTVTRALERRSVVQATLMRATIHLVSARDFWLFETAVEAERREAWKAYGHRREIPAKEMAALARKVRTKLRDGGVLSRKELGEIAGDAVRTGGVGMWLSLVRVPPSGTWERRRADLFAMAEEWVERPDIPVEAARERIVRAYLGAFGPARPREIANWAGLAPKTIDGALAGIETRELEGPDGKPLVDLPRAPLPGGETPAPPRFLPHWDASLLVHCRRSGILPEEFRPRVFSTKTPQSVATFLLDGRVAGTWRFERDRIALEPFRRLSKAERSELAEEADRLAEFHR